MKRALLVIALALALPATAHANWDLDGNGQPLIRLSGTIVPLDRAALVQCPPGGAPCAPLAWRWQGGRPGQTTAGTIFEVRDGDQVVERSQAWQGRATATRRPRIAGPPRVGQHVRPVAGTWTGGWGDDSSSLTLLACKTPRGSTCVHLPPASSCPVPCRSTPEQGTIYPSDADAAAIPPVLAGRYLIAIERRLPRDQRGWPIGSRAVWSLKAESSARQDGFKPTVLSAPVKIAAAERR